MKESIYKWLKSSFSRIKSQPQIATVSKGVKQHLPGLSPWNLGDKTLWITYVMLIVTSILVVFSSTAKMAYNSGAVSTSSQFLRSQIFYVVISTFVLITCYRFNLSNDISKRFFPPVLYGISLILMICCYFLGTEVNGATRWLDLGFFQLQPSEMLKVSTLLMVASGIDKYKANIHQMRILPYLDPRKWRKEGQKKIIANGFAHIVLPVIISCVVVVFAHLSSALIIGFVSLLLMILGRVNKREILRIVYLGIAVLCLYQLFGIGRSATAGGRVSTWIEIMSEDRREIPVEELSDTERSMIAIKNGGVTGVGAGQSAMRVEMIHPESDYAFAFVVEEYGFIGAIFVLLAYLWIFNCTMQIFERSSTPFAALAALGMMLLITTQALLHICVALNILPETGQTLPLISRGGSSLLFNAMALGLIMSVSRQNKQEEQAREREEQMRAQTEGEAAEQANHQENQE